MPIFEDEKLHEYAKSKADEIYKHPSAYKSAFIIRFYKRMGGKFKDDNRPKKLKQWMDEKWKDIGNKEYPVYRPTIKINKSTPLTVDEIDKNNLKKQIELKQIIKGDRNLPAFQKKNDITFNEWKNNIQNVSDPKKALINAKKYLGSNVILDWSDKPKYKFKVFDTNKNKWVYFGSMQYQDYLKHNDEIRKKNYLLRSGNMKGNWKDNKYSANNLSRNILWQ